ncbi:hypothetical protein AB9B37_20145 [Escherichia coli]|uniref:hypothetical protein n=1 Tax=Escherichia coli TaxID=562 RepID=UPI002061F48E|nr:MAG TPA: hypothetical protein [Caudoviricetes sp.]
MIRKTFRVFGGFVAFVAYWAMLVPLLIILLPLVVYVAIKYETVDPEQLGQTKEIKWVWNLEWPNIYLTIVEKITGWKG